VKAFLLGRPAATWQLEGISRDYEWTYEHFSFLYENQQETGKEAPYMSLFFY
jgi:hypothetical protein